MKLFYSRTLRISISIFVIIVLTGLVFSPVADLDFIAMDDSYYVTDNELIKDLSVESFFKSFHTSVAKNIQPLTVLSISVDYYFWKLNPAAYHIHNLILHILNALLVFFFVYLLSKRKLFIAFFSSLIFAVHPLHVESVAWISERKDVLYAFWFLTGLISYLFYKENKKANFLIITYFAFILSLLSKPTAVIFPVILIVLDYYLCGEFKLKQFSSKIMFFVFSIGFGLINLKSQGIMSGGHYDFPLSQKIIYSSYNIIYYFIHFFFPVNLSMFHDTPNNIPWFYYVSVVLIFLTFVFTVYLIIKNRNKTIVFGLLFFVSSLFLTLHIVAFSRAIVAERYTYLPYVGLAYSFLYVVFYSKSGVYRKVFKKMLVRFGIVSFVVFIFSYISLSYIKNAWRNSETIWSNTLDYYSNSKVAYDSRSNFYLRNNEPEKALRDIKNSLRIVPNNSYALLSLAYYYYYTDITDSVYSVISRNKGAVFNREFTELKAMSFVKDGNYKEALNCYDSIILGRPNDYKFRNERGKVELKLNLIYSAIEDFSVAISLKPDSSSGFYYRALSYSKAGCYKKAISDFKNIKDSSLFTVDLYDKIGMCYISVGDSIRGGNFLLKSNKLRE